MQFRFFVSSVCWSSALSHDTYPNAVLATVASPPPRGKSTFSPPKTPPRDAFMQERRTLYHNCAPGTMGKFRNFRALFLRLFLRLAPNRRIQPNQTPRARVVVVHAKSAKAAKFPTASRARVVVVVVFFLFSFFASFFRFFFLGCGRGLHSVPPETQSVFSSKFVEETIAKPLFLHV